jgi:hypothetical protein
MNPIFLSWGGKNYDWGSITVLMFNSIMIGIDKLSINETRDSTNTYGFGQFPTGYGNKNFVYNASIGLQLDQVNQITKAAPFNNILQIPPFSIKILLGYSQDPLVPPAKFKMLNCRFTTNNNDFKQNDSVFFNGYSIAFAGIEKEL